MFQAFFDKIIVFAVFSLKNLLSHLFTLTNQDRKWRMSVLAFSSALGFGMSMVYNEYSVGPNTEPRGPPASILTREDDAEPTFMIGTLACRLSFSISG